MALQDYSRHHHAGGAKCIRVTGAGKKQQYFPQSQRRKAVALDRKFQREIKEKRKQNKLTAEPSGSKGNPLTLTAFEGIRMAIAPPRSDNGEYRFLLTLQTTDTHGSSVSRSRVVYADTLDEKWTELITILARARGHEQLPKAWHKRPAPQAKHFNKLARSMGVKLRFN